MADRYWVGGTGTWNTTSTTVWSASSGGPSGASVPTTADNVIFDQATTYTVTMTGALACLSITVSNGTVTFATGTSPTLAVAASMNLRSGTVWNFTGTITFTATTSQTITTNGTSFNCPITFNGVGGTWALQDALTVGTTRTITLTNGTLNLNGFTLTTGLFASSNSTARTIAFGAGSIIITSTGTAALSFNNATNLTITGTPIFQLTTATTAGMDVGSTQGWFTEANSLNILIGSPAGSAGIYISGSPTTITLAGSFKDVVLTGSTGTLTNDIRVIYGILTIPSSLTLSAGVGGTTFAATSGTKNITTNGKTLDFPIFFNGVGGTWALQDALTAGTTRTITLTAGTLNLGGFSLTTGTFASSGSSVRSITSSTATTIFITRATTATVWNTATVTNFTTSGNITVDITGNNAVTKTVTPGALSEANSFHFIVGGNGTTITFSGGSRVDDLTITNTTCTISNAQIVIYGNLNIQGASPTLNAGASGWTFAATSSKTITTNGKTLGFPITLDGAGGTWTLQDALTMGTRALTLTTGTLNLNNLTVTTDSLASSGSNARSIAFGTGTIILTASSSALMLFNNSTNLTMTGTPVFNLTTASGTVGLDFGGTGQGYWTETNSLDITVGSPAGSAGIYISGAPTSISFAGFYKSITLTGLTATLSNQTRTLYGNLNIPSTITITSGTSVTTFASTSGTARTITTNGRTLNFPIVFNGVGGTWVLQDALTTGVARTCTLTAGILDINGFTLTIGYFRSANSNTRTIAFGTGNITVIATAASFALWETTATGLTVTGTPIVNITGGGSTAQTILPGSLSESNSISFNITAGTQALTIGTCAVRNLDFTGFSGSLTSTPTMTIYGNLTLSSTMVALPISSNVLYFGSTSGTKTITSVGKIINNPIEFNGVGGTWVLQDNMEVSYIVSLVNGTIDLNSKIFTAAEQFLTGAGTKNITFNGGTLRCIYFNNANSSNFTTTAGTGTGKIDMFSPSTPQEFIGNGSVFNCTLYQSGAQITITGSNTFNDIANDSTAARAIEFAAGTTTTVQDFTASGSPGNFLTLSSDTPGIQATLSKSSGTVDVSYCIIQDLVATGGAIWNSLLTNNNTNSGNNTGWIFALVSGITGQFFAFF
jgi:hypothetical protein